MTNEELIDKAAAVVRPRQVGDYTMANVGSALVSEQGSVYQGVCKDKG